MADSLIGNVNGSYYRNLFKLTGHENTVKVIVEDEFDVPFWSDILHTVSPFRDYRITPYTYESDGLSSTKGKLHILDLAKNGQLNHWFLGCVDSDYDYLLSSTSLNGQLMQSNCFLLQTYAYSVENLLCCIETLETVCTKANKTQPMFDISNYMHSVSRILYPLLIWSLYLESKGNQDFTASRWGDILPCSKHIYSTEIMAETILNEIQDIVSHTLATIEHNHSSELSQKQIFENNLLSNYNLTPDNCYLYVRGHDFYNFVLNAVLKGIESQSRRQHREKIRCTSNNQNEVQNLQSHYTHLLTDTEDILETNYEYKHFCSEIYIRIKEDINKISDPM